MKRRFLLFAAAGCVAVGVTGQIVLWGGGKPSRQPARAAARALGQERLDLLLAREELSQRLAEAGGQVVQLTEERAQLLERLKALERERGDALEEAERLRGDLRAVGETLAQAMEEAARLTQEAASLRKAQAKSPPPSSPGGKQAIRAAHEKEIAEAKKDAEYVFSKERQRLEKRLQELDNERKRLQAELDDEAKEHKAQREAEREKASLQEEALRRQMEEERSRGKKALEEAQHKVGDAESRAAAQVRKDKARLLAARGEADEEYRALQREFAGKEAAWKKRLEEVSRAEEEARAALRGVAREREAQRVAMEQMRTSLFRDWIVLYLKLGNLEARQGRFEEAEEAFKRALQLQPASAVAHYNLAVLYDEHLGQPADAIREYESYLVLTPQAEDAEAVRGWVQMLKADEASRHRRQAWNEPGWVGQGKALKELLLE